MLGDMRDLAPGCHRDHRVTRTLPASHFTPKLFIQKVKICVKTPVADKLEILNPFPEPKVLNLNRWP